jgi:AcrR family transcriptional regulator
VTPNPAFLAQVAAELLRRIDDADGVPIDARRLRRRVAFAGGYAVDTFCWRHRVRIGGLDIDGAADALIRVLDQARENYPGTK